MLLRETKLYYKLRFVSGVLFCFLWSERLQSPAEKRFDHKKANILVEVNCTYDSLNRLY